jgi:hypothetical protein
MPQNGQDVISEAWVKIPTSEVALGVEARIQSSTNKMTFPFSHGHLPLQIRRHASNNAIAVPHFPP